MRLSTCDKWHPDKPSEIVQWVGKKPVQTVCKLCRRIRHTDQKFRSFAPYGVIPLAWKPPEGVS